MQNRDIWKLTKEKREKLKDVYSISDEEGGTRTIWKGDESKYEWKQEIILEGGKKGEWKKGGELK